MLKILDIHKTYPNGVKALDGISLEMGPGMLGLLGPNGAGKSTLMRTLATLQKPDEGNIVFNGLNVIDEPNEVRKILGYLPQEFGVYPKMSARKLLEYFALLKGLSSKSNQKQRIDYVLELTNLQEVQHKNVSEYSGGMKQRFGIAQLLLNQPQLIIVDEPTAGLDPEERRRFLNVLRAVGTENLVLFSTHIVDDVTDLCNKVAMINKGKLLTFANPKQAISDLEMKVWSMDIPVDKLPHYQSKYDVISSHFTELNHLNIRVYSKMKLQENFEMATPNLEDVYLISLNYKP